MEDGSVCFPAAVSSNTAVQWTPQTMGSVVGGMRTPRVLPNWSRLIHESMFKERPYIEIRYMLSNRTPDSMSGLFMPEYQHAHMWTHSHSYIILHRNIK